MTFSEPRTRALARSIVVCSLAHALCATDLLGSARLQIVGDPPAEDAVRYAEREAERWLLGHRRAGDKWLQVVPGHGCPAPTTSWKGATCCCGDSCCWDRCTWEKPPTQGCLTGQAESAAWRWSGEAKAYRALSQTADEGWQPVAPARCPPSMFPGGDGSCCCSDDCCWDKCVSEAHPSRECLASAAAEFPVWKWSAFDKFYKAMYLEISCGGHTAASCSDCPRGNGDSWCNGDCAWVQGACVVKNKVSCGDHSANSCGDCPGDGGHASCKGDCEWIGGTCAIKHRVTAVLTAESYDMESSSLAVELLTDRYNLSSRESRKLALAVRKDGEQRFFAQTKQDGDHITTNVTSYRVIHAGDKLHIVYGHFSHTCRRIDIAVPMGLRNSIRHHRRYYKAGPEWAPFAIGKNWDMIGGFFTIPPGAKIVRTDDPELEGILATVARPHGWGCEYLVVYDADEDRWLPYWTAIGGSRAGTVDASVVDWLNAILYYEPRTGRYKFAADSARLLLEMPENMSKADDDELLDQLRNYVRIYARHEWSKLLNADTADSAGSAAAGSCGAEPGGAQGECGAGP